MESAFKAGKIKPEKNMKRKLFGLFRTDRRGLALISVLGVVTLATILIMALFSVSDAEYRASKVYAEGNSARHLADSAIAIVQAQIQTAATGGSSGQKPTIWATQPGGVRTYNASGQFIEGRTLFSSSNMVTTGTGSNAESRFTFGSANSPRIDPTWTSKPDQWVDLNQPVLRAIAGGPDGGSVEVTFPVLDPRARLESATGQPIEGFDYDERAPGAGQAVPGVVKSGRDTELRCPMPVEWLYVLKDGTVGTVSVAGGGDNAVARWSSTSGSLPSEENPIVGRVAFWADDESTKINVNASGEPSPWLPPTVYHNRDLCYSNYQPVVAETYRFPGHPHTISLSTVLSPGTRWDTYSGFPGATSYPPESQFKDRLYELLPRIEPGGTRDGTVPFSPDDFMKSQAQAINWNQLQSERLYLSVDEFLFSNRYRDGMRQPNELNGPANQKLLNATLLNRTKFFLTANSSSPETNMFSYPRVAIWPIPDKSLGAAFRQGNDWAMEASAKLGDSSNANNDNVYAFRRYDADSALSDVGVDAPGTADVMRNSTLLNYLDKLMNSVMPGGSSFATKYSGNGGLSDQKQILIQIFDYIRCTNLFDNYLNDQTDRAFGLDYRDGGRLDPATIYRETPKFGRFFTYTEPRFQVTRRAGNVYGLPTNRRSEFVDENVVTGAYPGHGQVRPIEWRPKDSSATYKGFGRFPTISEVALHFICTADGLNTEHSYTIRNSLGASIRSGGLVAQKIDQTIANERFAVTKRTPRGLTWDRWYSNLPPFPDTAQFRTWGCDFQQLDSGREADPALHPAWDSANWNCTLEFNPDLGGIPLLPNEKRIQVAILLETFIPAAGWTKYVPDWSIVLKGEDVNGITVTDSKGQQQPLFSTTSDQVIKSTFAYIGGQAHGMNEGDNVYSLGGAYGTGAMLNGRRVKGIGNMPKDPNYFDQSTDDVHADMNNMTLVSNFVTVRRDQDIQFNVSRPLNIEIYSSHDWQGTKDKRGAVPVQSFQIEFPQGKQSVPTPDLVLYSTELIDTIDENGNQIVQPAVHAVRWWTFNYGGAVNRYVGNATESGSSMGGVKWTGVRENIEGNVNQRGTIAGDRTWGRMHGEPYAAVASVQGRSGSVAVGDNRTIVRNRRIPTSGLIYGFSSASNFAGVGSWEGSSTDNRDALINGNGLLQAASGSAAGGRIPMGQLAWFGTDSVRSMIPRSGDYRLIAARKVVPKEAWIRHPVWQSNPRALFAHNITSFNSNSQAGADFGDPRDPAIPLAKNRLVPNTWYHQSQIPDIPLTTYASNAASKYADWDNGSGVLRDGAYINKPDDGNLSVMKLWHGGSRNQGIYLIRNAYFTQSWLQVPSRDAFFSPNRLATSPGVFGSLPTGVFGSLPDRQEASERQAGTPWRTLLFRADIGERNRDGGATGLAHPGASHLLGGIAPADHYIMDLFWMPVIDPRPMSMNFATEGKINMNYQILPFHHINRATGLHAALKGELIASYSQFDTANNRTPTNQNPVIYKLAKSTAVFPHQGWSESSPDNKVWYRHVNIPETLKQFEERFNFNTDNPELGGLFRTASQICELHMIPAGEPRNEEPNLSNIRGETQRRNLMGQFWASNRLTGDNTRERIYTNIYQKLTTRSNTFRVYFKAQTLTKARTLAPDEVDTTRDTVTGEYQGSALIQRYLDMSKFSDYPDYAKGADNLFNLRSLEHFYRYRVLEMKQFAP